MTRPQGARFHLQSSKGTKYLGIAQPSSRPAGYVHIYLESKARLEKLARRFFLLVSAGLLVLLFYFLGLCFYFSKKITHPIQKLTKAVESSGLRFEPSHIQDFDPQGYPELSIIKSAFNTEILNLNSQFSLIKALANLRAFLMLQPSESDFLRQMKKIYQSQFELHFLGFDPHTQEVIFKEGRFPTGGSEDSLLQDVLGFRNEKNQLQNQAQLFHEQVLSFYDHQALEKSFQNRLKQEKEFEVASSLQLSLLPKPEDSKRLACHYQAARFLGGDFFDFGSQAPLSFYMIADVAGKGLTPALYALMIKSTLDALRNHCHDLEELMRELNQTACSNTAEDSFCTLFLASVDETTRKLEFVSAGHNQMLLLRGSEVRFLSGHGLPLGILETGPYVKKTLDLESEDLLFLYTDGCTEAQNNKEELFGLDRLTHVLRNRPSNAPDEIKESLIHALSQFTEGAEQSDDIAFVVTKLLQN